MTIASVANSSVPLIPLNDLAESAAVPSGPAICTARPCAFACAMPRMASAEVPAAFQPFLPRLTGTTVSIARPSLDTNGPATCPRTTRGTVANRAASDAAFARSAAVTPAGRSYTTTAEYTFGDWNRDCRASTFVDCACAGSHDWASFFSAPVSLPASEPAAAKITIHRTRTTHLPRRPLGKPTIMRALLIPILLRSPVLWSQTRSGPETHRSAARHNASPNTLYLVAAFAQAIYLVNGGGRAGPGCPAGPGCHNTCPSHDDPGSQAAAAGAD